jgi:putative transposase
VPSKNSIKQYLENGFYHLYNRGVEKREIFKDSQDYGVFLGYVKEYLVPRDDNMLFEMLASGNLSWPEKSKILQLLRLNNFAGEIDLIAYCLMPNHFHFLVHQKDPGSIDKFMNSLGTRYSMYFNKRHDRVGSLYQDVYKAVLVTNDVQLLHLSRYIHKQAFLKGDAFESQPSSYLEYCGARNTEWIKSQVVLDFFPSQSRVEAYKSFVEDSFVGPDFIEELTIEDFSEHF